MKYLYLSLITILWFNLAQLSLVLTVFKLIPVFWGVVFTTLLSLQYIAWFGWVACIKTADLKLFYLTLGHILPFLAYFGLFSAQTLVIFLGLILIGIGVLIWTINSIQTAQREYIRFLPDKLVTGHSGPLLVWMLGLACSLIYANTVRLNPAGVQLEEIVVRQQLNTVMPFIGEFFPQFNLDQSLDQLIKQQIAAQGSDLSPKASQNLISEQVNSWEQRFNIELTPQTTILQAFITYLNQWLERWVTSQIWAMGIALVVFFSQLPFIGLYQWVIGRFVLALHQLALKLKITVIQTEPVTKENLVL